MKTDLEGEYKVSLKLSQVFLYISIYPLTLSLSLTLALLFAEHKEGYYNRRLGWVNDGSRVLLMDFQRSN